MKAAGFAAAFSTALLTGFCADAQDAGALEKWLSLDSPQCVPVAEFKSVSTVTDLTPEQFQFVRALYVAPITALGDGQKQVNRVWDFTSIGCLADSRLREQRLYRGDDR